MLQRFFFLSHLFASARRHRLQPARSGAPAVFTLGTAACWAPQRQRGSTRARRLERLLLRATPPATPDLHAADGAVARTATLRRRTRSRTRAGLPCPSGLPSPSRARRGAGVRSSSGYVAFLRRVAVANAAPSVSAERPCGWPSRDTGETKVASQQSAPPQGVTP